MNATTPDEFQRRILLAVTGLSPQVVTETLYALATTGERPFVPTEVHLITTAEGSERARLALLSNDRNWFERIQYDYKLPAISFDERNIHVMRDSDGTPIADIRTPQENLRCADFITETVRGFTADSQCALHVSIAGGRKTMGFYLGYALSLFGRDQDRLSHVLVSEPFESSWDFFYPTPYSRVIEVGRHGSKTLADTRDAVVTLADIPFVSLRHGLPDTLLDGTASFAASVDAARGSLGPARLEIDIEAHQVRASGREFTLPPAELALLCVFARRAIAGAPPLPAPPKEAPDEAWAERYLRELRLIAGPMADLGATERTLKNGMDGAYFSPRLSKLRRLLKRQLGRESGPYLIDDGGGRQRKYCLALPSDAVTLLPRNAPASLP